MKADDRYVTGGVCSLVSMTYCRGPGAFDSTCLYVHGGISACNRLKSASTFMSAGTSHTQTCMPDSSSSKCRRTRNPGCSMKYADRNPLTACTTQGCSVVYR